MLFDQVQIFLFLSPPAILFIKWLLHFWYYKQLLSETGAYEPLRSLTDRDFGLPLWKVPVLRVRRKLTKKDYLFTEFLFPFLKTQPYPGISKKSKLLKNLIWLCIVLFYISLIESIYLATIL